MIRCGVYYCRYVAEVFLEDFGDFPVCALHDARATRGLLEKLKRPAHFWSPCGRPMVLPIGDLEESDLEHVEISILWLAAGQDPELAKVPSEGRGMIHPDFDLVEDR
jgi:hypothetical protein